MDGRSLRFHLDSAENMQLPVPGMKRSKHLYEELSEAGGDHDGRQTL
ncbi:hypothetical protein [Halobacillus campisalis]|uniref:Uncharacterized protein n=1 Tax=Halobacillus campisalis TaxID=435909 RepID=A0ABW2K0U8_9BACI|nr:hypothetical protein [Halobacillus campisalis]